METNPFPELNTWIDCLWSCYHSRTYNLPEELPIPISRSEQFKYFSSPLLNQLLAIEEMFPNIRKSERNLFAIYKIFSFSCENGFLETVIFLTNMYNWLPGYYDLRDGIVKALKNNYFHIIDYLLNLRGCDVRISNELYHSILKKRYLMKCDLDKIQSND